MTTNDPSPRDRWRMTFDELTHACDVSPQVVDRWAQLGALGPRLKERRDRGWHRHVDRLTAGRAVIMSRLVHAGVNERVAARIAAGHEKNETSDIVYDHGGVTIRASRQDLP